MQAQERKCSEYACQWERRWMVMKKKGGTVGMNTAERRSLRWRWLLLGLAAALVFTGVWSVKAGRRLFQGREAVEQAIEQLDLRLAERSALLPGLVSVAEEFPELDSQATEQLSWARQAMDSAVTMDEKIAADEQLSQAVIYLLNLPQMQQEETENLQLQQLRQQLEDTEKQMAEARKSYNDAVLSYNNDLLRFPGSMVGQMLGLEYYNTFAVAPTVQSLPADQGE